MIMLIRIEFSTIEIYRIPDQVDIHTMSFIQKHEKYVLCHQIDTDFQKQQ